MKDDSGFSLSSLRKRLHPAFRAINARKAIVFGSFARGTQDKRSDLDMIVVMDTRKRFLRRYKELDALYDQLKGIAADILVYTPSELDSISDRPFIKKALQEGKLIYER